MAETGRSEAETGRSEAETGRRNLAETGRSEAETGRRNLTETGRRNLAETGTGRSEAETGRVRLRLGGARLILGGVKLRLGGVKLRLGGAILPESLFMTSAWLFDLYINFACQMGTIQCNKINNGSVLQRMYYNLNIIFIYINQTISFLLQSSCNRACVNASNFCVTPSVCNTKCNDYFFD